MPAYRHLFFDLDRTLWDMDRNSRETLEELYHRHKLKERGILSFDQFSEKYNAINKELWQRYSKGLVDKDALRVLRYRQTLAFFGIKDDKLARKIGEEYIVMGPLKPHLLPGTEDALKKLAPHFQLHIITNGFEEVQKIKMKHSGLHVYFKELITSERSGHKKPDTRMFAYALKKCRVKAQDSIMIGDDYEADIAGARQAGIDQVWFNIDKQAAADATHTIARLDELPPLLLR